MELNVLLEGYVSKSVPEGCVLSLGQSAGLEAGAAEVYVLFNIVVVYTEIPGARFLPVLFTIGETCGDEIKYTRTVYRRKKNV